MQMNFLRLKNIRYFSICIICVAKITFSANVHASFGVMNENNDPYYGNGQGKEFHKAITGGNALTQEQQQSLDNLIPSNDNNRFYGSGHINFGSLGVSRIENRCIGNNANGKVVLRNLFKRQTTLDLAVGHTGKNWRIEGEFLLNKNLDYNSDPVLTNVLVNQSINSQLKNMSIFVNAYYDFNGANFFRPYGFFGAGVGVNTTQTQILQAGLEIGNKTFRAMGLGVNMGAGVRYRAFSNIDLDIKYRYSIVGPVQFKANDDFRLLSVGQFKALSVGFVYFF